MIKMGGYLLTLPSDLCHLLSFAQRMFGHFATLLKWRILTFSLTKKRILLKPLLQLVLGNFYFSFLEKEIFHRFLGQIICLQTGSMEMQQKMKKNLPNFLSFFLCHIFEKQKHNTVKF